MIELDRKQRLEVLQRLFDSPDGEVVLEMWKDEVIKPSCVGTDPHQTYYFLGQKEWVQDLINKLEIDPEELEALESTDMEFNDE